MTEDTEITIDVDSRFAIGEDINGISLVGYAYVFGPAGTVFGGVEPVKITMKYDPASVSSETALDIYYFDEALQDWVAQGATLDTVRNKLTIEVWSFSTYAVGEIPDGTPPETSIQVSGTLGSNDWHTSDVTVTLTATDDVSGVAATYYSLDGGAYTMGTSFTVTSEGGHTVSYYSVDVAGNEEEPKSASFKIDKTPPVIIGSRTPDPNENGWNNVDVTVHFDCSDEISGVDSCTPDSLLSNEGAGQSVTGVAVDKAGNSANAIVSEINIDKTKPVTEESLSGTPGNNDWYTSDVEVTLTATDNLSGVAATYYSLDLGDYLEGTSLTVTSEGGHTVSYYSVDVAGNEEEPKSASFKIDKTPPEITINSPSAAEYEHSEIMEVDFTAVDDVSGVYRSTVFLDGQEYDPANPIDLLYLPLGTHTLRVESENYAGLVSTESVEFEVIATIDSLISIKDRLYEMGEIDNRGIATSLNKKLKAAKAKIDSGQNKPAKNILEAFINEVDAQRGKHITEFAADVLKTDAEYVIGQL